MKPSPSGVSPREQIPGLGGVFCAAVEADLAVAESPPVMDVHHRTRHPGPPGAVCDPMQHVRVFLAGDAAHLITPAGGKGMNVAVQDAVELAGGLSERYGERRDGRRLSRYTQTRLPAVWRHQ